MLTTNQILNKGRYRIINQFSRDEAGGMYEAYDTVNNSNVVLKESVGSLGKVATSNQRDAVDAAFVGSARVLTKIRHDALVSVQDYFSEIGRQYLVLESVTGYDLTKFLQPDAEKPELSTIIGWADQLLGALHYLHKLSPPVIHKDVRPENIRFTSRQSVKLLTAAIDTKVGAGNSRPLISPTNGNKAFHYKPLEQLWAGLDQSSQRSLLKDYDEKSERVLLQEPDAQSDIYSLGASIYHVLTGVLPANALDRSIALREGKPDPLQKPYEIDASIPLEISDAVLRAMEIRREKRFDSAVIMAQVLCTVMIKVKEGEAQPAPAATTETPPSPIALEPETVVHAEPVLELLQGDDSIEARLERERAKSEEIQRELEAEQSRLEEEQKRIEERRLALLAEKEKQMAEWKRLELEAEQERLRIEHERRVEEKKRLEAEAEQERQKAAQRLAELEAEQEKRRAEAGRLAREAEEERTRAEERLQQLHADQERQRAEQERVEAEVKEELLRAEKKLQEISAIDTAAPISIAAEDEDQSVLEIETSGPGFRSEPEALELFDSGLINVEKDRFDQADGSSTDFGSSPDFGVPEASPMNWKIPAIGGGIVLVLVVTVVAWMSMSSGETRAPAPTVTEQVTAPPPSADIPQSAYQDQSTVDQSQPGDASVSATEAPAADQAARQAERSRQAQTAQEKAKKPAPSPANTPKKVTVDDLINDN